MATTETKISKQERVAFGCLGGEALFDEFRQEQQRDPILFLLNVSERVAREFLYTVSLPISPEQEDAVDKHIVLLKDLRRYIVAAARGEEQPEQLQQLATEWGKLPLLLSDVHWSLAALLIRTVQANESNTYCCEHCGRIGDADRSSKRWCSDKCRMRATRNQAPET